MPPEQGLRDAIRELRRDAREDALPDLDGNALRAAFKCLKRKTALGADQVSPGDLLDAPPECIDKLAALWGRAERALTFPVQCMAVHMVALPKGEGDERLIGLLPVAVRGYFKARKGPLDQWSEAHADFWDSAVRKSGALRAALLRAFGV